MELNKIYNEDCLQKLSKMANESVDLIITSPPYNKKAYETTKTTGGAKKKREWRLKKYDTFGDDMAPDEYEDWQRKVILECLRVLKPTGSLFYNHKDILTNGKIIPPKWVYEFDIHQQIIWNRGSSVANDAHYFQPNTEYVYWFVKDSKQFYFNKQNAIYKTSVWNIPFEIGTAHPAPFPKNLVANIILSCSKPQSIVYDAFMGGGTVALMCKKLNRNYIGSEISGKYVEMTEQAIRNEAAQLTLF